MGNFNPYDYSNINADLHPAFRKSIRVAEVGIAIALFGLMMVFIFIVAGVDFIVGDNQ